MRRLAFVAASAALLSGCSLLGGADIAHYEAGPQSGSLHHLDSGAAYQSPYVYEHHNAHSHDVTWQHAAPIRHNVTPHIGAQTAYTHSGCVAVDPCRQSAYAPSHTYAQPVSYAEAPFVYSTYPSSDTSGFRGHAPARADRGHAYVTFGAQQFEVGDPFVGLQGRMGYQSANYVGVEVEGSYGIIGDEDDTGGIFAERMIENQLAGFVTTTVPLIGDLSLRGRAGYHFTEGSVEETVAGITTKTTNTEDGFAWGGGAEFTLNDRNAVRADYTRYHLGSGGEAFDSASLAWVHTF